MADPGMTESPEPTWLRTMVDQRVAFMLEQTGDHTGNQFPPGAVITTPLTEPEGDDASREDVDRWDRTCDNCGTFVPEGRIFLTGHCTRALESSHQVVITFGSCEKCWES